MCAQRTVDQRPVDFTCGVSRPARSIAMRSCGRVAMGLWVISIVLSGLDLPLVAGDGGKFQVTQPAGSRQGQKPSGLTIDCDCHGWSGSGYRQIRFDIQSASPVSRQRTLTIEVAPNSYYQRRTPLIASRTFTLPKGHTQSSVSVLVPQYSTWAAMRVDVYEEGRRLDDVSMNTANTMFQNNPGYGSVSEAYPTMLFLDSDAPQLADKEAAIAGYKLKLQGDIPQDLPDIRSLALLAQPYRSNASAPQQVREMLLDPDEALERGNDLENLEFVRDGNQLEILPPEEIPDSWLGLTSVDLVFIELDDLVSLNDIHPAKLERLLKHVSTGATLVVHGLDKQHERLEELTALLTPRFLPLDQDGDRWQKLNKAPGNSQPQFSDSATSAFEAILQETGAYVDLSNTPPLGLPSGKGTPFQAPSKPMFLQLAYKLGTIVAVAGDEPFHNRANQWNWFFARHGPHRWMWYQRHGLSFHRENHDYWKLLIPSIGRAPVNLFLFAISGFALLVGPVNYWLLRRSARLYLMLATVPAAAGIVTLGMLAVVLFQDGLGTRLRSRSVTRLDPHQGQAVSLAWQSYYSGVAPTGGLKFPVDAAVLPICYTPQQDLQKPHRLRWEDDRQVLADGYHRSRTLTQCMVIHPHRTKLQLEVRRRAETGVLEVVNRLGVPIELLVIADQDEKLHWIEKLPAGGQATAALTNQKEIAQRLKPLRVAAEPELPPRFQVDYHTRTFAFQTYYSQSPDEIFTEPSLSTSLLELELRRDVPHPLHFRAYTTEAPASVPLGIDNPQQVAGLHVIEGPWKP